MVEQPIAAIGHHQPEQNADGEAQDQTDAHAEDGPRQKARNDRGHRRARRGDRDAQIAAQQIEQIVEILLPERRVQVDGEKRRRLHARVLIVHALRLDQTGDVLLNRIAGQQANQKEDDRADHPHGEERLGDATHVEVIEDAPHSGYRSAGAHAAWAL